MNCFSFCCKCIIVSLILILFLNGCGGSGGDDKTKTTGTTTDNPVIIPTETVSTLAIKPDTITISPGSAITINNTTDTSLTLKGDTTGIQPGKVIVSSVNNGLIRKITSVTPQNDNTILVATTPGHLEDIVQSGALRIHRQLSGSGIQIETLSPDIVAKYTRKAGDSRDFQYDYSLTFNKAQLGDITAMEVSGTIQFSTTCIVDYVFDDSGTFQEAIYLSGVQANGQLTITSKAKIDLANASIPYAYVRSVPIPIPGTPITFTPEITLGMQAVVGIEAGMTLVANVSTQRQAGFRVGRDHNFVPQSIASGASTGEISPEQQNYYGQGKVEFIPFQQKFAFLLAGVAGPEIKMNTLGFEVELNRSTDLTAPKVELTLRAVNKATVGCSVGILGNLVRALSGVTPFEYTLWETPVDLMKKTWANGLIDVNVQ